MWEEFFFVILIDFLYLYLYKVMEGFVVRELFGD